MKICFKCHEEKDLSLFYKHAQMKDGYLNKCKTCTFKDVLEWRSKNPEARKEEHKRNREKQGFLTRKEYDDKRKVNAKGRKYSANMYAHKRRLQLKTTVFSELDELVFLEATDLREKRNKLTGIQWHIDHVVPINYKKACGLHNAFNLQVVPANWNVKKGNTNMETFFVAGF